MLNQNGKTLRDFVSFTAFRIENSFFQHQEIHKFSWNFRGLGSVIDYFITNEKLGNMDMCSIGQRMGKSCLFEPFTTTVARL